MNQFSLWAYEDVDWCLADQQAQKIIACLSNGGTDRSHIQKYTGILDQTLAFRLKELKEAGAIKVEGECMSVSRRKAGRWVLNSPNSHILAQTNPLIQ